MANIDDVRQMTGPMGSALDAALVDVLPKLETDIAALLDAKDVAVKRAEETSDNLSAMITDLNGQIVDLRAKITSLEADLLAAGNKNQTLSAEVADLQAQLAAVPPVVTPPPPVSPPAPAPVPAAAFPSPRLQHAILNPTTGFYESTDGWQTDIFALGFDVPGIAPGKTLVIEALVQASFDPKGKNVKVVRGWDAHQTSPTAGKCNLWVGQSPDGWQKIYVEGTSMPASQQTQSFSFPSIKPRRERWEIKFPTATGKSDGSVRRLIDGVQEFIKTGLPFDTSASPGLETLWFLQIDYSPNAGDTGPFKPTDWVKIKPVQVGVL